MGQQGNAVADGTGAVERKGWWRFVPLGLVLLGLSAVLATGAHRYLSLEAILAYRTKLEAFVAAHTVWAAALYVGVYVTTVALSVPGAVFLTLLGGFLFGWLMGGALALVSATAGAVLIFLIARTSIGDVLIRKAGRRLFAFAEGFRQDAFAYVLFLRIQPVVPFWITNLASALLGVPLRTFALATLVGLVPGAFAFATAGAGLDSVLAAQVASYEACRAAAERDCTLTLSLDAILTPQFLAALGALALLSLGLVAVRRWRARAAGPLDRGPPGP